MSFLPREKRTPTPAEMAAEAEAGNGDKPAAGTPEVTSIDSLEAMAVEAQKHADGNGRSSNAQGVEGLARAADALYAQAALDRANAKFQADAPPCPVCGSITVRSGACYKCANCGATTGCS